MKKVVMVDEVVVADVQSKDVEATVAKEVIQQLLNTHSLDEDPAFFNGAVYKAYESEAMKKRLAFDRAKEAMAVKFIPAEDYEKVVNWSCDYFTNQLTYTIG